MDLIEGVGGDGLGMIQPRYIYRALYFYYDYISSILDHQTLDPRVWRPLSYVICMHSLSSSHNYMGYVLL